MQDSINNKRMEIIAYTKEIANANATEAVNDELGHEMAT